ncbi:MAG TPA: MFS transporter [Solirubrobacteraceae bacterium]
MNRVLHLPSYRRLLVAYGLNELAWSVGTLALALLVYRRTGSALGATAFFICSQVAPAVLSPLFVSRMDQRSPRGVLPVLYVLEGALFAVLAALTSSFSLIAVLILVVLDGSVAIVARSLARAATVEILRPLDLLHEGNALTNLVFSICYMAGPALGGVVVAAGGTVAALLVNSALFAGMAVVLVTASGLPRGAAEPEPTKGRVRSALSHVRNDPPLRWMLVLQAGGTAAFAMSIPVEVVLSSHTLHAGAGGYGALMSGWGAGAVVGSAVYARWRRRPALALMVGSAVAMASGFALMAAAPSIVVAVIGAALGGVGNGGGLMAAKTLLQEYTPQRWMAIVTSLNESISQLAPGVGILLGGALAAVASPRLALGVAAVGTLTYAALASVVLRPARLGEPPAAVRADGGNGVPPDTTAAIVPIPLERDETLA